MSKSVIRRMIKNAKKASELIITPELDRWLLSSLDEPLSVELADLLHDIVSQGQRDRAGSFSGSRAGQCYRAQTFGFIGVPGRGISDAVLANRFDDGRWRHLRWQVNLLSAGLLKQVEVPIPYPNPWRLKGSMDGIGFDSWTPMMHGEFMFELKGWSALVDEPVTHHVMQMHRYMLAAQIDLGVLVYEHKSSQEWREFLIPVDQRVMSLVEEELEVLNEAVDAKVLPRIREDCAARKGQVYLSCPYRDVCLDVEEWEEAENLVSK